MIKKYREDAGLSRAEMSRIFEIPIRTLEDWDSGKRTPPVWAEKLIVEKLKGDFMMKINGMGNVSKKEVLAIFTKEAKDALNDGTLSLEEAGEAYKLEKIKSLSKIGAYGDTFRANLKKIPQQIYDKLPPEDIAALVDILYAQYNAKREE